MRTPITLKIKFKSSNLDQFIERYSVDVSRGGIFIRTKEPLAVGTQLKFEFQLQDASALIAGEGTVVWIRQHDPSRTGVAPGMGVKFDKLQPESQKVLDQILSEKQKRGEAQMESRFDAGVRASASASGVLSSATAAAARPRDDFSGGDSKAHTPLPAPAPGLAGSHDEFSNESTRVMQDSLVSQLASQTRGAAETHQEPSPADEFAHSEPTRRASAEQMEELQKATEAKVEAPKPAPSPKAEVKAEAPKPASPPKVEAKAEAPKPVEKPAEKAAAKAIEKPAAKPEEKAPPKEEKKVAAAAAVEEKPAEKEVGKDTGKVTAPAAAKPQKKSSSVLPILLAVGVVGAGGAYVVMNGNNTQPTDQTPSASATSSGSVTKMQPKQFAPDENAAPAANTAPATNAVAATEKPAQPEAAKPTEAANPTEAVKPTEAAKPAGLSVDVKSDPPGAQVLVNGKPLPNPTPTTLDGLDAKKVYAVQVTLKGFHPWKVSLKPKAGDKPLEAALVPNEKVVEVSTTPAGADVILDGKKVGKTPFVIHKIDASKEHALELKRAGFVGQSRTLAATDVYETKGDKDVLAVAMKLEPNPKAETPAPQKPVAQKAKPVAKKPATKPATEKPAETADKPATEKPAETADKPATEKPATEKPAETAAEKPAIKVPAWMKKKPASDQPEGTPPAPESPPSQ